DRWFGWLFPRGRELSGQGIGRLSHIWTQLRNETCRLLQAGEIEARKARQLWRHKSMEPGQGCPKTLQAMPERCAAQVDQALSHGWFEQEGAVRCRVGQGLRQAEVRITRWQTAPQRMVGVVARVSLLAGIDFGIGAYDPLVVQAPGRRGLFGSIGHDLTPSPGLSKRLLERGWDMGQHWQVGDFAVIGK